MRNARACSRDKPQLGRAQQRSGCGLRERRSSGGEETRQDCPDEKKAPSRRCTECTHLFDPDPRVGDRQVTCGAAVCQRQRHAYRCKRWHERNAESAASHYADVVQPYRQRHPGYQRRWRIVVSIREIREQMLAAVGAAGARVRRLVLRGRVAMSAAVAESAQVRATTGEPLAQALAAVESLSGVLDELAAVATQLGIVGE